eukprot:CAMPEP_0184696486 /NCGR_PEP_ID=MMETSP0313-20130426/3761_1 /TAXON_ID=2792 /ORGANISM="Porphyridium aerugineum, Strain SAG 1380-2" /LENGTH=130 /DNA_ID=CAMNT_0027155117 /DNA_START=46 /DNA_END=435 /DNA_ORIENTATION=+
MAFISTSVSTRLALVQARSTSSLSRASQAVSVRRSSSSMLRMKASSEPASEGIWQGDWECVDCNYTYSREETVKFENLPDNWRCPQCRAPKRRFAKKAGSVIAKTTSTSNTAIVVVSMVALVALLGFAIW